MFYTVDFGTDYAGLATVGMTQLQADGAVVVARTTAGVVALGLGVYGAEITPDALCAVVRWDTGTDVPMYAHEAATSSAPAVDYPLVASAVRTELQAELTRIVELAKLHGLVIGVDLVVSSTSRSAGDIVQTISGDGLTTSTVSRTA